MPNADFLNPRPSLTNPSLIVQALKRLGMGTTSDREIWSRLTQNFAVDLDEVAALLPAPEPEPIWLNRRGRSATKEYMQLEQR